MRMNHRKRHMADQCLHYLGLITETFLNNTSSTASTKITMQPFKYTPNALEIIH